MTSPAYPISGVDYAIELERILKNLDNVTDVATLQAYNVLADLGIATKERIEAMANQPATQALLKRTIDGIDDSIVRMVDELGSGTIRNALKKAVGIGEELAHATIPSHTIAKDGTSIAMVGGLTTDQARIIAQYDPKLITNLSADYRKRVTAEVAQVAAGVKGPQEAIDAVGGVLLDSGSVAGHIDVAANRARAIIVTEVGRVQALATHRSQQELAKIDPTVRKRWINAHLRTARPAHLEAEARYAPGGEVGPIEIDGWYRVGAGVGKYPRDPQFPAGESIHCHCVSITHFDLDTPSPEPVKPTPGASQLSAATIAGSDQEFSDMFFGNPGDLRLATEYKARIAERMSERFKDNSDFWSLGFGEMPKGKTYMDWYGQEDVFRRLRDNARQIMNYTRTNFADDLPIGEALEKIQRNTSIRTDWLPDWVTELGDTASDLDQSAAALLDDFQAAISDLDDRLPVEDWETLIFGGTTSEFRAEAGAEIASKIIQQWAHTSGDSDVRSLAIQKAVADVFDLEEALEVLVGRNDWDLVVDMQHTQQMAGLQQFIQAMYDDTQEVLAQTNTLSVKVHRGIGFNWSTENEIPIALQGMDVGDSIVVDDFLFQPASSTSTSRDTAEGFTGGRSFIMEMQVPADRILGMPNYGFGCLNEEEIVMLHTRGQIQIRRIG